MEILYVTTMVAIFVLCLALLVTARRILQSSPLTNGDLSISSMYETQMPVDTFEQEDEETESPSFADAVRARMDSVVSHQAEQQHVSAESVLANWVTAPMATAVRMSEPEIRTADANEHRADGHGVSTAVLDELKSEPVVLAMEDAATELPVRASTMDAAEAEFDDRIPSGKPSKEKRVRERKPLAPGYAYALDCLLLGVSVLALVASQRGGFRNKSVNTSHHRVA